MGVRKDIIQQADNTAVINRLLPAHSEFSLENEVLISDWAIVWEPTAIIAAIADTWCALCASVVLSNNVRTDHYYCGNCRHVMCSLFFWAIMCCGNCRRVWRSVAFFFTECEPTVIIAAIADTQFYVFLHDLNAQRKRNTIVTTRRVWNKRWYHSKAPVLKYRCQCLHGLSTYRKDHSKCNSWHCTTTMWRLRMKRFDIRVRWEIKFHWKTLRSNLFHPGIRDHSELHKLVFASNTTKIRTFH